MIIRRRHTKNFTTVPNEMFDGRLSLDEVGLLSYLLSRPPDWEIRRAALARQWAVGGVRLKRMFNSLMKTGWCQAYKIRLIESGQFRITYDICDEPGPPLSDEEVRRALSLVSSEAAEDDAFETDDSVEPCAQPPPTQPGVDDQGVATGGWEESLNKDSPNTDSTKATVPIWRDVRQKWPLSDILSPLVCEKLWAALSQADKHQAYRAIEPYIANCRAKNRKLCDLSTYLKERRFVGKLALPASPLPIIRPGTPQAARWLEYWQKTNNQRYASTRLARGESVTLETEWPPAFPTKNESTGPPELTLMSPEDHKHI